MTRRARAVLLSLAAIAVAVLVITPAGAGAHLQASTAGAGVRAWAWSRPSAIDAGAGLTAVSCPSLMLCVASDNKGNVLVSYGAGGGWRLSTIDPGGGGFTGLDCASSSLCVAVDAHGAAFVSTNPGGGVEAWSQSVIDPGHGLTGISCPSTSLCVASDDFQAVVTSTDPTGGAAAWTRSVVDTQGAVECFKYQDYPCTTGLLGVSCPTAGLCVAIDQIGHTLTSINPAEPGAAWTLTTVDVDGDYGGWTADISCPSASLCVIADSGQIVTSTAPTGGPGAWSVQPVAFSMQWLACPLSSLCVTDSGALSTDPEAGGLAWHQVVVGPKAGLTGISCPTQTRCVAVDALGDVVIATPAVPPSRSGAGPRVAGAARVGARLRAFPGRWSGTRPIRFGYQWQRCDARCVPITDADLDTYRVTRSDLYQRIRVQITPWDPAGYARPAYSAQTRLVKSAAG